jgi:putative peptidoglycan lipid II flippase
MILTAIKDDTPSILHAAWMIALVTIASKFIGFARDMVVANFYGATMVSDAYFYALQIPSLAIIILGGVGGPFHSATVAVFSKLIPSFNAKPEESINRLYNTFLTITFLIFAFLAIFGFIFADKIMGLIISAGTPELISLATQHFKIMSPIILIGGIIGIFYGLLVTHKKFILPNLSPMVLSIIVIIAICLANNDKSGMVLATATTVGAICQLLMQFPALRKIGYSIKPNFDIINNPQFKNIIKRYDWQLTDCIDGCYEENTSELVFNGNLSSNNKVLSNEERIILTYKHTKDKNILKLLSLPRIIKAIFKIKYLKKDLVK